MAIAPEPSTRAPTVPQSAPGVHPRPGWSVRPASDREAGDAVVANLPSGAGAASVAWPVATVTSGAGSHMTDAAVTVSGVAGVPTALCSALSSLSETKPSS